MRCLEPGQKFRKFNPDHFPFFKNLYRTSGSRVSLPWLEIGSGRSGNGLRCLEPGQNFRKFNSEHFPFLENVNPTSGSRISIRSHQKTPHEGGGGGGGHFSIVKKCPPPPYGQPDRKNTVFLRLLLLSGLRIFSALRVY